MPFRVIVNGYQGKMGSLACETILNHPDFELTGKLNRSNDLHQEIIRLKPDIVIDLTNANSAFHNCSVIIENNVHPVIGTSGLKPNEIEQLSKSCAEKQLGGLIVPNFSISAILMMQFSAKAAQYFPEVEIIEAHHQQKLDAPSGTAIKTAEIIAKNKQYPKQELPLKELYSGARGAEHCGINIHSLRLPGVLARQQVIFGNTGETLSIIDDSIDRRCYMPGLILSCQKVLELNTLVYGLENLI